MPKDLSRPIREYSLRVSDFESGHRLDHFLLERIHWRSRSDIQGRIRSGRVLRNGRTSKPSARLRAGDDVVVMVSTIDVPDQDPSLIELSILHEDEDIVVIDKQAGLVVHPTGRHVYDTLMNALHLRYRSRGDTGVEAHVVHRLDRDTSGVIVVAKSYSAKQAIQRQFEERIPKKRYLALVSGSPRDDEFVIDVPIQRALDSEIRMKMETSPDGSESETHVIVLERFDGAALVEASPRTGRQHQIRVHLAATGLPILCDPLYGDGRELGFGLDILLSRQALHAAQLEFRHPISELDLRIIAPLHSDMRRIVDGLRDGRRIVHFEDRQSARWRLA